MGICCSNGKEKESTMVTKNIPERQTKKSTALAADTDKSRKTGDKKTVAKGQQKDGKAQTKDGKAQQKEEPANKLTERLTELRAAILIQKWFRLWLSKLMVRRELVWSIFQKVEYYGERNQMRLNRFFRGLIEEFSKDSSQSKQLLLEINPLKPSASFVEDIVDLVEVPPDFEVNIFPPFSLENLNVLINFLKMDNLLPFGCVANVLIMTTEKLKTKSNVTEISTSVTQKLTICGDLHGSLDDLLTIFYKNDVPSLNNPYVFNGDFVDRGPKSVEVAIILCYCFLLFPNHVHLNRGNHEDPHLNERYGFFKEIVSKYQHHNKKLFTLFKGFFRQIPLCTIIDRKIFVCHGGISNTLDLNILAEVSRGMYHSVIKPPKKVVIENEDEWEQVVDILWSDPSYEDGCAENELRGGGKCFGPDITDNFLKNNNFELLIRSHECKSEGYEYEHSGKVLTIFSCSNYYHQGSNKGAYIIYTGDIKQIRLIQYLSNFETMKNIKFTDRVISMEDKAIMDLKRMIFMYRNQLQYKFKEKDKGKSGKLTIDVYSKIMSEELGLNLPWRLILPKICEKDANNLIIYESTFNFIESESGQQIKDESSSDILFSNMEVLEVIFRAIDRDNSGFITMSEFEDAMGVLQKHSDLDIKTEDLVDLGKLIDLDNDGFIDINEFFEAFKISRT